MSSDIAQVHPEKGLRAHTLSPFGVFIELSKRVVLRAAAELRYIPNMLHVPAQHQPVNPPATQATYTESALLLTLRLFSSVGHDGCRDMTHNVLYVLLNSVKDCAYHHA
jgi:hypothetical protein